MVGRGGISGSAAATFMGFGDQIRATNENISRMEAERALVRAGITQLTTEIYVHRMQTECGR